jgi:glycerophosphoryl diester phosphodiesterase
LFYAPGNPQQDIGKPFTEKADMKPLFIKVHLLDLKTKKEFPVQDGIEVDVVNVKTTSPDRPVEYMDSLKLELDPQTGIFQADAPDYALTRNHTIRVQFVKTYFSLTLEKLLAAPEIDSKSLPVLQPVCFMYLDPEWQRIYRTAKQFGSKENPLILKVPIVPIYNIAHRGAPYYCPENTLASFKKALELSANGLELDLCLTKDKRIIVFHDPKPVNLISPINRINVENLPYALISPKFVPKNDGMYAVMAKYVNGHYTEIPGTEPIPDFNKYDIINLTLDEVREVYRYRHTPDDAEYEIPTFEEFLAFSEEESQRKPNRLQFLYLDVKNPGWNEKKDAECFVEHGSRIGDLLSKFNPLPENLVIGYTNPRGLAHLKQGIEKTKEKRCVFAYDAPGSLASLVDSLPQNFMKLLLESILGKSMSTVLGSFLGKILRKVLSWIAGRNLDPLKVALRMNLSVIAIGCLGRPQNLEEIKEAVYDREHNPASPLRTIVHYTLNDPAQIAQSLALGVNAIVTDKPDEFKSAFGQSL